MSVAAFYLTYSRSALLGLAASVGLLALLKYRKLIPLGILALRRFSCYHKPKPMWRACWKGWPAKI